MSEQRSHWDTLHRRRQASTLTDVPTAFARECAALIDRPSAILELGCGAGQDAAYLADRGHTVWATDFSEVVIAANRERYRGRPNLHFRVLNIGQPLPFDRGTFDVVYAHLSLHYLPDALTRRAFREIHQVLRPRGQLFFLCKSVDDPLYGLGRPIESDMFEHEGHVRHFFSEDYAISCLGADFEVVQIEQGRDRSDGKPWAFVKVSAQSR